MPKGFEKYFPGKSSSSSKDNNAPGPKIQIGSKNKPFEFKTSTSGGGGGGSGAGADKKPDPKTMLIFGAAVAAVMFYSVYYESYREITWRDFTNEYLMKGNVDKVVVVNKKWAMVQPKTPEQVSV